MYLNAVFSVHVYPTHTNFLCAFCSFIQVTKTGQHSAEKVEQTATGNPTLTLTHDSRQSHVNPHSVYSSASVDSSNHSSSSNKSLSKFPLKCQPDELVSKRYATRGSRRTVKEIISQHSSSRELGRAGKKGSEKEQRMAENIAEKPIPQHGCHETEQHSTGLDTGGNTLEAIAASQEEQSDSRKTEEESEQRLEAATQTSDTSSYTAEIAPCHLVDDEEDEDNSEAASSESVATGDSTELESGEDTATPYTPTPANTVTATTVVVQEQPGGEESAEDPGLPEQDTDGDLIPDLDPLPETMESVADDPPDVEIELGSSKLGECAELELPADGEEEEMEVIEDVMGKPGTADSSLLSALVPYNSSVKLAGESFSVCAPAPARDLVSPCLPFTLPQPVSTLGNLSFLSSVNVNIRYPVTYLPDHNYSQVIMSPGYVTSVTAMPQPSMTMLCNPTVTMPTLPAITYNQDPVVPTGNIPLTLTPQLNGLENITATLSTISSAKTTGPYEPLALDSVSIVRNSHHGNQPRPLLPRPPSAAGTMEFDPGQSLFPLPPSIMAPGIYQVVESSAC